MTATTTEQSTGPRPSEDNGWYAAGPVEVAARLGVDPAVGLSGQRATELLEQHGPNDLPAEASVPGWKRLLGQYRTYMQLILVAAAIVSLAIKEWSTGALLL